MCRAFATTLKGTVRDWYRTLRLGSINSFLEMEQLFTGHFLSSQRIVKTTGHLMSMAQGEQETLKKFMHRFNTATLEICNLDMGVALAALTTTLQPESFLYSLGKNPLVDMGELMARAQKYINLEEMMDTRGSRIEKRKSSSSETRESYRSIRKKDYVSWPEPVRTPLHKRNMSKFHAFHRDQGHDTEEYIQLKKEIETLIRKGYLSKFIKKEDPQREPLEQRRPSVQEKEEQVIGEIGVIFGGSTSGGDSGGARKRYAKKGLAVGCVRPLLLQMAVGMVEDLAGRRRRGRQRRRERATVTGTNDLGSDVKGGVMTRMV
ncbi:uncharacterized protein LOC131162768 [Malania oleifera]|uniref:uncharacterized protein LOC131162768 n=1 Tax=Malania oleifera TaxID=397392 RepID=UPI0025ADF886|nr:uncharacterized protein LOC131162768 [Malania oleifera]